MQVQAAALKMLVFRQTRGNQRADIHTGTQQKSLRGSIEPRDRIILNVKTGLNHHIQQVRRAFRFFHGALLNSPIACAKWRKTYPAGFDDMSILPGIDKNSKR